MEPSCRCGNPCLKPSSEVIKTSKDFYSPCHDCKEFELKKFSALSAQINLNILNGAFGKCICGKRHLDLVMAHILKIMIENGVKDERSTLRSVCVPLITPAYPLDSVPYLREDSLVILSGDVNKECAQRIFNEVPEVKGVLKGNLKDTVGIKDSKTGPKTYDLMAGCDMRCDIVNTPWGVECIYKYQSQIHIELPKPLSPKIKELKRVLNKYDRPTVLDCTCGPGTLGIAALLAGARRVVFSDVWYPACQTTAMNLEINGFSVEFSDHKSGLITYGKKDSLAHKEKGLIASGENFEVYCLDVRELRTVFNEKFDVCLVDVFPGVDSKEFKDPINDICLEMVVI